MNSLTKYLKGGDFRSIGKVNQVIGLINSQSDFDLLFNHLNSTDRLIVMRAADAIEKITITNSQYLNVHKDEVVNSLKSFQNKEFKWHLALLISRIDLTEIELEQVWSILMHWVKNTQESKIVRVNSLQALYILSKKYNKHEKDFNLIVKILEAENIPSINARINKLMRQKT